MFLWFIFIIIMFPFLLCLFVRTLTAVFSQTLPWAARVTLFFHSKASCVAEGCKCHAAQNNGWSAFELHQFTLWECSYFAAYRPLGKVDNHGDMIPFVDWKSPLQDVFWSLACLFNSWMIVFFLRAFGILERGLDLEWGYQKHWHSLRAMFFVCFISYFLALSTPCAFLAVTIYM